ncbi:MAG: hypothetical protein JRN20_11085 [Nitrososphaerota archaeon]|nr:hypothetical protein [Nitrososphaerota archaeon]
MNEKKRDDFTWLVALLEERRGSPRLRSRLTNPYEEATPELRRLKRRRELLWMAFLLLSALSIIVPLISH